MPDCVACGDPIHDPGAYHLPEVDGPVCRSCHNTIQGITRRPRDIGIDEAERAQERLAHERMRYRSDRP